METSTTILLRFTLMMLATARCSKGADIFQCPDESQKNYPHTERCDHYFTCLEGLPIIRGCPASMLFDSSRGRCADSGTVTCLPYQRLKSPTDDDRIILMAKGDGNSIETTPPDYEEQSTLFPSPGVVHSNGATPVINMAISSWLHTPLPTTSNQDSTAVAHCPDEQISSTPSGPTMTSIVYITSTVWL